MPVTIPRGPRPEVDEAVRECVNALDRFAADHPGAEAEVYRHGLYSVRFRVVWGGFRGVPQTERRKLIWTYLETIPEEPLADITFAVLATPEERGDLLSNLEFDDPSRPLL